MTGGWSSGVGPSTSATANQLSYLFINELGNTPDQPATKLGPFKTLSSAADTALDESGGEQKNKY
jgi:hypothetical protein